MSVPYDKTYLSDDTINFQNVTLTVTFDLATFKNFNIGHNSFNLC